MDDEMKPPPDDLRRGFTYGPGAPGILSALVGGTVIGMSSLTGTSMSSGTMTLDPTEPSESLPRPPE